MTQALTVKLGNDAVTATTYIHLVDGVLTEEVIRDLEDACRAPWTRGRVGLAAHAVNVDRTSSGVRLRLPLGDVDYGILMGALKERGFQCV